MTFERTAARILAEVLRREEVLPLPLKGRAGVFNR
jgi:hypothetical protein